ncbi:MAG TPA: acetyl ornithine aminotransferase family protein [Terriglobales bacterium]|nr:acetyl ornithine aminotransferase family protein [Terriglobales bacterium]
MTKPASLAPELRTALPGPASARIVAADQNIVSPSYTRDYPLVARKGEGMYLQDADGNRFLDFTAGIAVCSTGHCHPAVVAAIQHQAAELIHMSGTDFYYEQMVRVGELISAGAPMPGPHRVFYGNSGAEAVEAALKLARWHTRRPYFIGFYNCFHGRTFGALSMTCSKPTQRARFAPLLPGFFHITYPNPYRPQHGCADPGAASLDELERLFRTTTPAHEVAAIVLEPVQGEGGYIVPPKPFVQELRRICDREGILLIADEVQSGAGRTGKMWAIQHFDVAPDIVCSAKGIASGMPLGVTFARADIMDWTPGAHASTFGGNPVSLAAAEATINLLNASLIRNAAEVGHHLLERLRDWPARHPTIGEVRGLGLMIGIEIVSDQAKRTPDAARRDRIVHAAFERGLLVLGCGPNSLRLMPPLICSREQADTALAILQQAIAASA